MLYIFRQIELKITQILCCIYLLELWPKFVSTKYTYGIAAWKNSLRCKYSEGSVRSIECFELELLMWKELNEKMFQKVWKANNSCLNTAAGREEKIVADKVQLSLLRHLNEDKHYKEKYY